MRAVPDRLALLPGRTSRIIGTWSPEFSIGAVLASAGGSNTSWTSANKPLAIPFRLSRGVVVTKLGWINGTSPSTNFDLGIYTGAFARLVSTGSTARAGAALWQWVDVTDTALQANTTYYLVGANDSGVANQLFANGGVGSLFSMLGCQDSATSAFPLPDPLTNMAASAGFTLPIIAMSVTGAMV